MRRSITRSIAAPWCALAILLAACTGSGAATEDDQPIEQPAPKPETPAEPNTPDVSDDPNNPDNPDVPDNPNNPENPNNPDNPNNPGEEAPQYEDVKAVLKEILGDKYEAISGEVSQNITLTAQTIDAVTDIFPDLKAVVEDSSKMTAAKTKVNKSTDDVKKALVAQVEEKISLTKKELIEENEVLQGVFEKENKNEEGGLSPIWGSNLYYISNIAEDFTIYLSGEFDYFYNHIESLEGDIDISKLEIVSHLDRGDRVLVPTSSLKEEIYNKLKLESKNGDSLPTLNFGLHNNEDLGLKYFLDIYDKYNKSKKLQIDAHFGFMDGRTLVDGVDKNDYTLFESDGNTAKESTSPSIKSFKINELIDFAEKYHISEFMNLIISRDLTENKEVDWGFTNIIFEGDVSKLINSSERVLNGIVYFKDLPYNNKDVGGQGINGVVKLNKLEGLKNFKINDKSESQEMTHNKSVVDLRGINKDKMEKYNPSYEDRIFKWIGAVYFAGDVKTLAENDKLYTKFINYEYSEYINNEYFGDSVRKNSIGYEKDNSTAFTTSKTARKLSEFEYFGNNRYYEESAKDSYKENLETNNFEGLNLLDIQIERLKNSNNDKTIAKVTTLCPLC